MLTQITSWSWRAYLINNVCDYKMLYTNTIIPTVSTSINVVHSSHCAIIVCCVCGSLGRWNWSIIKAPMCCHLSLWDLRPCVGGDPGERTSVTMVILIRASIEILEVGLIELDYYRFLNEGFKHRFELIKCQKKHESQKFWGIYLTYVIFKMNVMSVMQ